eukprot:30542-Pelagococcus_subviridis.AAC.4
MRLVDIIPTCQNSRAVAKRIGQRHRDAELRRGRAVANLAPEVLRDDGVVRRAVLVRLPRELLAHREVVGVGRVRLDVFDQRTVVGGVDQDVDERMVLRRRADHRRAADVDVLHASLEPRAAGDRLAERIQVHRDDIDVSDVVRRHRVDVRRDVAAREDAGVYRGVERLHAAVEHLRVVRDRVHRGDVHARVGDGLRAAAGADDLVPELRELRREVRHARLVADADERARLGAVRGFRRRRHRARRGRALVRGGALACDVRRRREEGGEETEASAVGSAAEKRSRTTTTVPRSNERTIVRGSRRAAPRRTDERRRARTHRRERRRRGAPRRALRRWRPSGMRASRVRPARARESDRRQERWVQSRGFLRSPPPTAERTPSLHA